MAIYFDEQNKVINLQTPDTSYIIGIYDDKLPVHIHYGRRLEKTYGIFEMLDVPAEHANTCDAISKDFSEGITLNTKLLELPTYGTGDYRMPAFHARYEDGSTITKLYYTGHKIYDGKPELKDMPSSYVEDDSEAQTLELYLKVPSSSAYSGIISSTAMIAKMTTRMTVEGRSLRSLRFFAILLLLLLANLNRAGDDQLSDGDDHCANQQHQTNGRREAEFVNLLKAVAVEIADDGQAIVLGRVVVAEDHVALGEHGQARVDGDRKDVDRSGLEQREDDVPEFLELIRAVDIGSLIQIARDGLKASHIIQDVHARPAPDTQQHHRKHRCPFALEPGDGVQTEHRANLIHHRAVQLGEHHAEDDTGNDDRAKNRHVGHGLEEIGELRGHRLGVEQIRQHQRHRDHDRTGDDHVARGVLDRDPEVLVLEHVLVVLDADPLRAGGLDILEGHQDRGDQRIDEEDHERDQERQNEDIRGDVLGIEQFLIERNKEHKYQHGRQNRHHAVARDRQPCLLHGRIAFTFSQRLKEVS